MTTPRRRLPVWIWNRILTPVGKVCGLCKGPIWLDARRLITVCQRCDRTDASPLPTYR